MATVLLTTDGSELAAGAMARAVALLGREHRFHAVTVVTPEPVAAPALPMSGVIPDPDLVRQAEARQEQHKSSELAEFVEWLGIDADQHVLRGDPGTAICGAADEWAADVVVVGSHGHGHLKELLLGSVSRHVLQHAPCPVLTVRPD